VTDPIIGIDLGTSNSSVAVVDDQGRARVLTDGKGRGVVPSIVSFHPSGEVLIGGEAKHRRPNDPRNTVFSIKRIIGRAYGTLEVGEARRRSPFAIYKGDGDRPQVVTRAGKFTAEEISALILDHMRRIAETALGQPVERAVITVPANFHEAQRQATAAAAEIAGIVAVRLLNEPTAAALAYGHGRPRQETVAVYDFGGGTFDVSILRLNNDVYEVLATAGDMFLGGEDIDDRLVEHEVAQFLARHRVDLRTDPEVIERLRATIEGVKCALSTKTRAVVLAEGVAMGPGGAPLDLSSTLTRDQLNGLIKDIVDRSFPVVDEALRLAQLGPGDIDEVILVGGTTRIPYVRQRVAEHFGRAPRTDVDPEQAVALGAAIQGAGIAALLDRRGAPGPTPSPAPGPTPSPGADQAASARSLPLPAPTDAGAAARRPGPPPVPAGVWPVPGPSPGPAPPPPPKRPRLLEVTPKALSIATVGGFCEKLIGRNQTIPHQATRQFTTARDNQEVVEILVASGDSRRLDENLRLGTLVLAGLPPRPRGEVQIAVTFHLSEDGILLVSAIDPATGVAQSAKIELEGVLPPEEIAEARARLHGARL
jgi:molecular chaperone DnaK